MPSQDQIKGLRNDMIGLFIIFVFLVFICSIYITFEIEEINKMCSTQVNNTITYIYQNTEIQDNNRNAINERTNNTINGIYFPVGSFCVAMGTKNTDALFNTISHEYVHDLIMKNKTCGDQGCYEHFCK